uniref:Armadillo repeat containing 10 n=1 Tax=Cyclopterus lumpus TaxID=8103 RepID=A0A8C3A9J5_CYCLU
MGDASITPRLGNMRALLGIVAGAGASYGLYKLISGGSFKRNKKSAASESPGARSSPPSEVTLQPGEIIHQSPGNLDPQHLKMLLSCLQTSNNPLDRCRILLTLGNSAAFTVNQNLIREFEGIHIIAGFLSDPAAEVRVQTLNALNNLCMNIPNQEQIKHGSAFRGLQNRLIG